MESIIFFNGDIITMENKEDKPEAILVENGVIKRLGSLEELEINANGIINKIDLQGKTLMPSFIDAHSHITAYAKTFSYAKLNECKNIEDILKKLEEYRKQNKINKDNWIIGVGYDDNSLEEKRHPSKDELRKLGNNNPILITHVSGHMGVFNKRAEEILNLKTNNGYLEENEFIKVASKINNISKKQEKENLIKSQEKYLSYGITTVQDGLTKKEDFELLKEMSENKNLKVDIISYIDLEGNRETAKVNKDYIKKYKNNLKIGGYKIILDGSPQARTAYLSKPYEGEKEYRGYPSKTNEQVKNYIKISIDEKMQLLIHCNGDAAADQLINCIKEEEENYKEKNIIKKLRPIMIHAQTIRKDQILECKKLGIIPSYFIAHVYYWGDIHIKNLGKRAYKISPANTTLKNNLIFTFHQDTPVLEPNMLETIDIAVNRKTKSGVTLGEDEKIDVYDALKAVTINSAYSYFEENEKGSLKEGKIADLVILDKNPLKINKQKINTIIICSTWKNGKEVFKNNNL